MTSSEQMLRRVSIAGLLVPVACVLLCFSYALRARLELGYWASYNHPDPKSLGWPIHHLLILASLFAIYPALISSVLSAVWLLRQRMILSGCLIIASVVLLWFGMTWLGKSTMGHEFMGWYLD